MVAVEPDVTTHGPGDPEIALVGGVHGDEPSGVRAVERLREAAEAGDLELQRGIKLIIANPPAVEANARYLDTDLNRTFPGDPNGNREERLAAKLCAETEGLLTFSIHATHSQDDPIALFDAAQPGVLALAARLPVPYIVDHHGVASGSHSEVNDVLTVEAGCQGTEAAAVTAEKLAIDFLRVTDCLPGTPDTADSRYFSMTEAVPKPPSESYEFLAENFELVREGEVFARADGEAFTADEAFYPILMSAVGYADIFGYKGAKLGDSLGEARAAIENRRIPADD
ncbi:succinylglutamate desuccinylase [Natronomonas sp. EA1]|uniref:succinylglutamate desuccinylase n=1 Tax=Natronomonas sp. EA1 TaxID=3421655 RepID=UPI003EBA933B